MQRDFWNSANGDKWVAQQGALSTTFEPICDALMDRAGIRTGERVLDIGCGTGQSSRAAARAAGPDGGITGLDLAANLLAAARAHPPEADAAPIDYVEDDAADHEFGALGYHRLISQMGVMFFSDPVAAFTNIRTAAAPGATFAFAAWAEIAENPWFHVPNTAAAAEFGPLPFDPDAPGATAFWNSARVIGILRDAGWQEVAVETVQLDLTPPGDLGAVVAGVTDLGPAARILKEQGADAATRARVAGRIEAAFRGYVTADGIRVPASLNYFSGRAPH